MRFDILDRVVTLGIAHRTICDAHENVKDLALTLHGLLIEPKIADMATAEGENEIYEAVVSMVEKICTNEHCFEYAAVSLAWGFANVGDWE